MWCRNWYETLQGTSRLTALQFAGGRANGGSSMRRVLLIPPALLAAGVLAGRFVWPRERGIPEEEKTRVNEAWAAAAHETGHTTEVLAQRPAQEGLGTMWDFLQRLEKTPAAEFPALWEEVKGDDDDESDDEGDDETPRSMVILFAERWAELDPEAAYAFFGGKPRNQWMIAAVFRTWARMNVETALAAVTGETDEGRRAAALAGIFNAAAEKPADLIAWGRRLSFLDASKLKAEEFDRVIPEDALRKAFEADAAGLRELAAGMPEWFRLRVAAMTAAGELVRDGPGALARLKAAGLTKENASGFVLDMLPRLEGHPEKLPALVDHLTATLGDGWLDYKGMQNLHPLFLMLAKAAPEEVHAMLNKATAGRRASMIPIGQAEAALDLFATDPRLALQLAPSGDTWIAEFLHGPLLPAGSGGTPQETLDLVRTAPSSTMRNGLLHEALSAMMKSSPDTAAAWVEALPAGELKDTARVTLEHRGFTAEQAELERAAMSAAHGGDTSASVELVRGATRRLLREDPAGTGAQVMTGPAGPVRDAALERLGLDWSGYSTQDALTWAESLPPEAQPRALGGIMETWAGAEPAEASDYLAALPPGPERDAPAAGFARGFSSVDPAGALEWANAVQDAALRQSARMEVAGRWLAKNPDEAKMALGAIPGLTDAERQQLLSAPPPR